MLSTLLIVLLVVAIGSRAGDNLRVRQQEVILAKLPEEERYAYYDVLRRRVRRVAFLRAVAIVSIVAIFYAYKYHLAVPPPTPAVETTPARPAPAGDAPGP